MLTVVAIAEAVALIAVVLGFLHHIRWLEKQAVLERHTLTNRIQRPEQLPAREVTAFVNPPPREDDQLSMVGKIHISDKYGIE